MPIIVKMIYEDGTEEVLRIPAEIWRKNHEEVSKVIRTDKLLTDVILDPYLEIADVDRNNNYWPPRTEPTRFELFKSSYYGSRGENEMQKARRAEEKESENDLKK
jgi:hypothetical protein